MRNIIKSLFGLAVLFVSLNGIADDIFSNNKKGIWITPKAIPQNQLLLKSGEDFTFEGDICVVKWGGESHHQKCQKVPTHKLKFKAYFPDSLHDVSDKLIVTQSNDKKSWRYSLKTGVLKSTDLNQLTLTVGTGDKKTNELLAVKAKFEKRILILNGFKNNYAGKHSLKKSYKDEFKENLTYINKLITYLENLIAKIDVALQNNPEILAQIRQPLQVDNKISSSFYYSSNFSGHKLTLKIPVGVPFEGEKSEVTASVTNLSDKSFYFPEFEIDKDDERDDDKDDNPEGKQRYRLALELDGHSLISTVPFDLAFGETKTIQANISKLNPNDINKIKANLERSASGKFDQYKFYKRSLGNLAYDLPVIEDAVAPIFSNLRPLADTYHKLNPQFEATFKDSVGRIDYQTLSVILKGITSTGLLVNKVLTSFFSITTEDLGSTYDFVGNFVDLSEGSYEITYSGKDYAGNSRTSTLKTIYYDKTPPQIILSNTDNVLTGNSNYKVTLTIADASPATTKILQNGQVVFISQSNSINYDATLVRGHNTFEIQSTDAAGNVATPKELKNIVLDFTPPVIAVNSQDNQIIGKAIFPIEVTVTDQSDVINKVFMNGVEVHSTTQKVFTYAATLTEGINTVEIQSVDIAGNVATPFKLHSITLDTISPVIGITQKSGDLTNKASFLVSGTIADAGSIEFSIYINGSLVTKSTGKSFSTTVTLVEGVNSIEVKSHDQVGNEAIPVVLSNITLDSVPPILSIVAPPNGAILKGVDLTARAVSSEILKSAQVNGADSDLSSDKHQFEKNLNISLDGNTSIVFKAFDLAGNSSEISRNIIIDNTAPEIQILSRHGFDTIEKSYLFKLVINEINNVQTQVFFNGALLTEGSFKTYENTVSLKEGANSFLIKSKDEAGNTIEYQSREILVDSTAPTIASVTPQNILTNFNNFNISATFEDNSIIRYELHQNGVLISFSYEKTLNQFVQLGEGVNNFVIKASDMAGNQAKDFVIQNITLDTVKPVILSENVDNVLTNINEFNIKATVADVHLGETAIFQNDVEVFIGNGANISYNANLKEGKNVFLIKSIDLAKNDSDEFILRNVTLNTSKPIIASTNKDNAIVTDSKYVFNAKITDDLDTHTVVKQNGVEIHQTNDKLISINTSLIGGTNNFEIISTDSAGNVSDALILSNVNYDNVAPVISSTIKSGHITNQKNFTLNATIDDVSNVDAKVFLNGHLVYSGNLKSLNLPVTLNEGQNSFEIKVSDLSGNVAIPLVIDNIILDTVAPVIVSNSARDLLTKDPVFFINASAYDLSKVTFKLLHNNVEVQSSEGSFLEHTLILSEGTNKLEFIAIDAAGNVSEPFVLSNIILDTLPPVIDIASLSDQVQTGKGFPIDGAIGDQSSFSFQIYQNGSLVFEGIQSPFNYVANLATGENSFRVTATDALGNISQKDIQNIYLDNIAPVIELGSFPVLTKEKNFTLDAKIHDASGATTKIFHNGSIVETTSSKDIQKKIVLVEGSNDFRISSIDTYGNQSSPDQSFNIVLDSTSPAIDFYPVAGHVFNLANATDQVLMIAFRDDHKINFERLRIKINGELIENSNLLIEQLLNQVSITLANTNLPILYNKKNIVSIEIADELNNISLSSSNYVISKDASIANDKPIINFNPSGGIVAAPLASIEIGFSSKSEINYQSLNIKINGEPLASSRITVDQSHSKATLDLSTFSQTENNPGILIEAGISDMLGNAGLGKVGINFFKDVNSNLKAEIITDSSYESVMGTHICVALESGEAKCWGNSSFGALGRVGAEGLEGNLILIPNINLGEKIVKIRTGHQQTCAIVESGNLYCWGYNGNGSLGYGNKNLYTGDVSPKTLGPINIGEKVKDVVIGLNFICTLLESAQVKCWGAVRSDSILWAQQDYNSTVFGQLGYGGNFQWTFDKKPIDIPNTNIGGRVQNISAGAAHVCALMENGEVRCWGRNLYGQLGYGNNNNIGDNEVPADVGSVALGEKALQISAGTEHTCAILESKKIRCWGKNDNGQLGYGNSVHIGDNEQILSIPPISLDGSPVQISSGTNHSCALFENKKIKCWGSNFLGQLGLGRGVSLSELPINLSYVDVGDDVKSVQAMQFRTCVTLINNKLKCWGVNEDPYLGYNQVYKLGDNESIISQPPVSVGSLVTDLYVGRNTTCISTEGKAKCWGNNNAHLINPSDNSYIGEDGNISGLSFLNSNLNIKELSRNILGFICTTTTDQNVKCWGVGFNGELGAGNVNTVYADNAQNLLAGDDKANQVANGDDFSCVLLDSGNVRCWGSNGYGQLGRGNTQSIKSGVSGLANISIGEQVSQITAGGGHVCALTISGKVRCWGKNTNGQLGLGSTVSIGDNEIPSSIASISLKGKATQVSAGAVHTCAVLESGNIQCWGYNASAQLGYGHINNIGDNEIPSSQLEVNLGAPVIQVATGSNHTCALLNTGKMKCWGNGSSGKLGYGNTNPVGVNTNLIDLQPLPIQEKIIKIGVNNENSCALTEAGELRCWGDNTWVQLGYSYFRRFGDYEPPSVLGPLDLGSNVYFVEPSGQSVIAQYTPSIYYGQGPLEVSFNALTSFSATGEISTYQWDFNDGSPIQVSTSPFVTHIYHEQGVFSAKLTVTDTAGNKGEFIQYITVLGENILPIAKLSSNITSGPAPLSVQFSGSESHDSAGSIINYQFIFGDGTVINSAEANQNHIFLNPGHYSAKLIVTDNNGGKSTSEAILITMPVDPSAPVIISPTNGQIRTAETSFNIKANIQDNENVTVKIFHNGEVINTTDSKDIDLNVTLAEGNNYFEIQAKDELGHHAIPLVIGYIVLDTDVPIIASKIKSNTYTNQNPFSLDVKVSDSTRTSTKIFLNGTLVSTSLSEDFLIDLDLKNGSNKIEIISTDEFGLTTAPFVIDNIVLDQVAPVVTDVKPLAESTVIKRTVFVSAKSDEVLESASANGVAMTLSSDKKTLSGELDSMADGNFNVEIVAIDRAKNETHKKFKVVVDSLPPQLSYSNTSGYVGSNSTYTINASVNDLSVSTTDIYQNGKKVYSTTNSQISYNATLGEGANTFVIKSYDQYGNEVNPAYIGDINLDTVAPKIVSNISSNIFTNKDYFPVAFDVIESRGATSKIYKNGNEFFSTNLKSVSTNIKLDLGNNNLEIKSVDDVGNVSAPVSINNIHLDKTAPITSLLDRKDRYVTNKKSLTLSGSIQDEIETTTKFVINGEVLSTSSLKTFFEVLVLSEGINNIEVITEDVAGNMGQAVSLREIGLDTLPPVITSSISSNEVVYDSNFVIDVKVSDFSNASTELFVNGNSIYLTSNKEFNFKAKLNAGLNVITAMSADSFGHQSALTEIGRITYDNSAPVIMLAGSGDIYTNKANYNFKAQIEDASNVISYIHLNDQLVHTVVEKNIDLNLTLAEGANTLSIKAEEVGALRNSVKFIDNVVLDTIIPIIVSTSPQNFTTNESLYKLAVVISDTNTAQTSIYLNEKLVFTSKIKDFIAPIFLQSGLNNIRIEAKDIAGNDALSLALSNINFQSNNNIATFFGVGGGKFIVNNPSSKIYGTIVEVGAGAVNENVNLAVNLAQLSDLPNISGVPTPDPIGPVLDLSVSKRVSIENTFNNEVIVGIPFSPIMALEKKINPANLSIIRYDSQHGVVESIRPFKIDYAKGVAYGYTKSFSHFFVASSTQYPKMGIELPKSCRKLELGHACDSEDQNFNLSGTFRHAGLTSTEDLVISCPGCSVVVNSSKSIVTDSNENLIRFNISGNSIASSDMLNFTFKTGNLITKEKIIINSSIAPTVLAESNILLRNCFEPGAICKVMGDGSVADGNDGTQSVDSSFNIILGNIFGPNRFKLMNALTKHDGILYWIEPKNNLPVYKVQDLVNYRLHEFALRRKNLDGTTLTIDTFKLAIDSNEVLQNDWEYNFNLQVEGPLVFLTLDSSNHLYDATTDIVDERSSAKLISIDRETLEKSYLDESFELGFTEIKELKVSNSKLFVVASSLNKAEVATQYHEGLFKYDLDGNTWDYLTKMISSPVAGEFNRNLPFNGDNSSLSSFDGRNIANISVYNDEIYFVDSSHNCVRRFDAGGILSTVVGICNDSSIFKGSSIDYANANSTKLLLGDLKSIEIDLNGNIYLSQNLNGKMELSIVSNDSGIIKGGIKESSASRLPATTEALRMDHVYVPLDEREDSSIGLDNGNGLYFYNNACVYTVSNPYEYLFYQLALEEKELEIAINNANLSNIILETQSRNGNFSFESANYNVASNLSDSLDALRFLARTGVASTDALNKARLWISNQDFNDTKSAAKKIEALAILGKQGGATSFSPELRAALNKFLKAYRPNFSGWGATENHIINNEDTSAAIRSIAFIFDQIPSGTIEPSFYLSEFIIPLRKIINDQFGMSSGVFEGGFGPTNNQNMATLSITLGVVDGLIQFRKLDSTNDKIIAWNKKSNFQVLASSEIPAAVVRSLKFIRSFKNANGSFGDLRATIQVLNTLNEILKSGVTADPNILDSLRSDIMKGLAFIKSQNIDKKAAIELARLNAIDNISDLGKKITQSGNAISTPGDVNPVPGSLDKNNFGQGIDGVLDVSGDYNINQRSSGNRKHPDGVNAIVSNVVKKYVYVNEIAEGALNKGDEVLVINLQGAEAGSFKFAHINNISYNENPILIELDRDIVAAGFLAGADDKIMIQRVPNYSEISKVHSINFTADHFNGDLGGVLAFRVQGDFPENVSINVSGLGFRGGKNIGQTSFAGEGQFGLFGSPLYDQSASCGGEKAIDGTFVGGGGAYATVGIFSGANPLPAKSGSVIGSAEINKIFLGCGGGSGLSNSVEVEAYGGAGGGIAFVYANKITINTNTIKSKGLSGVKGNEAQEITHEAGGGSGGSIVISVNELVLLGKERVSVSGGPGLTGTSGSLGQNGGEGRIRINANKLNGETITNEQKNFLKQTLSNELPFIGVLEGGNL